MTHLICNDTMASAPLRPHRDSGPSSGSWPSAVRRCYIPECETLDSVDMRPSWLPSAVPHRAGKPDPCRRFVPLSRAGTETGSRAGSADGGIQASCAVAFSNETEECSQYIYPNRDLSIMTEVSGRCCSMLDSGNALSISLGISTPPGS